MAAERALTRNARDAIINDMRFDSQVSIKVKDAFAALGEPEAEHFLGSVYWALLVIVLVSLLLGGIGFGVWEFLQPLPEQQSLVSGHAQNALTKDDVEKVLEGFDARAKKFESRRAVPLLVRDPS